MSDGPVVCAWGDESIRSVEVARPMFLLGAVIADPAICDGGSRAVASCSSHGSEVAWRDADEQHHRVIHRVVAPMPVQHVVVVAAPADPRRPERARAKCGERMLHELDQWGVGQLIMEARTAFGHRGIG